MVENGVLRYATHMDALTAKRCIPCEGGVPPATDAEIAAFLTQVPGWAVTEQDIQGRRIKTLARRLTFKDFRATMAFLREVEELAEGEGHHPDFFVHYSRADFTLYTHAIGGLHENDFILAAKIGTQYDRFHGRA